MVGMVVLGGFEGDHVTVLRTCDDHRDLGGEVDPALQYRVVGVEGVNRMMELLFR